MAYTPENNPYIPGDPYSYDLAWMVEKIRGWKDPADSAERAKASEIAAKESQEQSEAWAVGTIDGDPVTADDPQYDNNSKFWAEEAADSAQEAKDYADNIADPVSGIVADWLDDHITNPSSPPIDTSLSVSGAAADAAVVGSRLSDLDDAIDEHVAIYVADTPWIKELLFIDNAFQGCRLNNVVINSGVSVRARFATSDGLTYLADTGVIPIADAYGIVPIRDRNDTTVIVGYMIANWPSSTYAPAKMVLDRAFDNAFSPRISEYINGREAERPTIVCIGDSITEGVITSGTYADHPYPYWLGERINADVYNYGISGANPKSWWTDVVVDGNYPSFTLDSSIDAVIIMFGSNGGVGAHAQDTDFLPAPPFYSSVVATWRTTYPTYNDYPSGDHDQIAYMCRIIEYIYAQCGNDTCIILCTPTYNDQTSSKNKTVINSVDPIKKIGQFYRIPVIDVLNEFGPNFVNTVALHSSDSLHFTEDAYRQLGSFIANKTASLLALPSGPRA